MLLLGLSGCGLGADDEPAASSSSTVPPSASTTSSSNPATSEQSTTTSEQSTLQRSTTSQRSTTRGDRAEVTWYPDFGDPNSEATSTDDEWNIAITDRAFHVGIWVDVEDGRVESIAERWVP